MALDATEGKEIRKRVKGENKRGRAEAGKKERCAAGRGGEARRKVMKRERERARGGGGNERKSTRSANIHAEKSAAAVWARV